MHTSWTILTSVACLTPENFSTLSRKRHDFRKKAFGYKLCVLFFSTPLFETFLILKRTERDMIKILYWPSCKLHIILARFEWNLNFLDRISQNTQISNFVQICSAGA